MMMKAPEDKAAGPGECRLYLRQLDDDDPFQVVVKWFTPSSLALASAPELRIHVSGESKVRDCLTRLGVEAWVVSLGEFADGTPISETRLCTIDELVGLLAAHEKPGAPAPGWYTLLSPGVSPEEMLRRMRAWVAAAGAGS